MQNRQGSKAGGDNYVPDSDLILINESFPFLISIGVKKCGINIKEHAFWLFNGIDDIAEQPGYEIKLGQCAFIHADEYNASYE